MTWGYRIITLMGIKEDDAGTKEEVIREQESIKEALRWHWDWGQFSFSLNNHKGYQKELPHWRGDFTKKCKSSVIREQVNISVS